MTRSWTAGLAACTAILALAAVSQPAAGQQKAKKAAAAASAAADAKAAPAKVDYAQRFAQVCAACHGANGRSDMPGVPVLAGQPSLYAVTQLFLFREGRRNNEAMTAVAKTLTDDDLRGFSDHIGTLPPVLAPAPTTPPRSAHRGPARGVPAGELAWLPVGQARGVHAGHAGGGEPDPGRGPRHAGVLCGAVSWLDCGCGREVGLEGRGPEGTARDCGVHPHRV